MPLVIPVFIAHQGCPHNCVFCNQYRISGQGGDVSVTPATVQRVVETWLTQGNKRTSDVQVAFYGGSFTGLPLSRQIELLDAVQPFLERGDVRTIRLSTRPDYIDPERVRLLKNRGVTIVELGIQSMDDRVLAASNRGHTGAEAKAALKLLQEEGIRVGAQLMIGLPEQTTRSQVLTAREVAALRPDFVRIYPVLVVKGSILAQEYHAGRYTPLTLNKAIAGAARMKKIFDNQNIRVVRVGLQPGQELEQSLIAGPYHPAFGELVASRLMFNRVRKIVSGTEQQVTLLINTKDQSIFRGVKSANMRRFSELGLADRFVLQTDADLPRGTVQYVPVQGTNA